MAVNLDVVCQHSLKPHISHIVRVSSFHIRNIDRIRKYLNQSAAEQIIHVFVTSRFDNGNALLYGLPQNQICRLQHIQNAAARVVTLSRKSCHNTPILNELHCTNLLITLLQFIFLNCLKSTLHHAICVPATCHS